MNLSMRDWIWIMGIVAGIATTYGMMSSRVSALESSIKDLDMLRIDSRLSVIEIQVIEINEKLDKLLDYVFIFLYIIVSTHFTS